MARARKKVVRHETEPHHHQHHHQHCDPVQPAPLAYPDGRERIGHILRDRLRPQPGRVVLPDQRLRISPDGPGDAPDIRPGVKVPTTRRVVVTLDLFDDRFPDAGPLANLGNGETGLAPRLREGFADAHSAPPLR